MKNNFIFSLTFLLLSVSTSFGYAGTIVVTNTNDTGAGSLRQAMTDADGNPGADTIVFNIPTSDPGYNSAAGVWTIQPATDLPYITNDSTFIDGTTQTANQGNNNPEGPEIEINGTGIAEAGIVINGSDNIIRGLVINRCPLYGIIIQNHRNKISGNYVGTDATGTYALPNEYGITISGGAKHNLIGGNTAEERNLISGNSQWGLTVTWDGTDSNMVKGNFIGTNASGDDTLCNIHGGVHLTYKSSATIVGGNTEGERNVISGSTSKKGASIYSGNGITIEKSNNNRITGNYIGTDKNATKALYNKKYGILIQESQYNMIGGTEAGEANVISGYEFGGVIIRMGSTKYNVVTGNIIGTDRTGLLQCEQCYQGVYLDYGAHDNIIGPGNTISNNTSFGVHSFMDSTIRNTITRNSIARNGEMGIVNAKGANDSLAAPVIAEVTSAGVAGTACADCVVEIFSDSLGEGAIFEGYTTADASGNFAWSGTVTGPFVTATATDTAGNTSEFSEAFKVAEIDYVSSRLADGFSLDQNIPNPFGGSTEIQYRLKANSRVTLKIIDLTGREVALLVNGLQVSGDYSVTWNGQEAGGKQVPDGIYFYKLEADGITITRKLIKASRY